MKSLFLTSALSAFLMASPAAAAEYVFTFSTATPLFGPTAAGSGSFITSDTPTTIAGQTAFQITSVTGQVNGVAINSAAGNYGFYFTTGPTFLDGSGAKFFLVNGGRVDFFNQSSNGLYRVNTFSPGSSNFVTASSSPALSAVPEPGAWAMMILGFGAIGYGMRMNGRRRVLQLARL